jgi:hypothetical protein
LPASETKDAGKENEAHFCAIHRIETKKFAKGNQTRYSYKTNIGWCNAKMEYTIGKWLNESGGIIPQTTAFVTPYQVATAPGKVGEEKAWIDELYLNAKILNALGLIFSN